LLDGYQAVGAGYLEGLGEWGLLITTSPRPVPASRDWRLCGREYGKLQLGLSHAEIAVCLGILVSLCGTRNSNV